MFAGLPAIQTGGVSNAFPFALENRHLYVMCPEYRILQHLVLGAVYSNNEEPFRSWRGRPLPLPEIVEAYDFGVQTLMTKTSGLLPAVAPLVLPAGARLLPVPDPAQYGFVIDGSCIEPLTVVNSMYEQALQQGHELHMAYLDATSAFDSVPHTALDAAMHRVGAPDDFIAWLRSVLHSHRRVAATAYAVDPDSAAAELEAGVPQGDPASPTIWCVVVDFLHLPLHLSGPGGRTPSRGGASPAASSTRSLTPHATRTRHPGGRAGPGHVGARIQYRLRTRIAGVRRDNEQ